ncbi:MAG: RsmE family RNA methyltransferase [Candidatus Kapabacteria bacterium]|nr:RsmE family RNA methyltransferase [Candidatus Kapabacteria bacterium]
MDHLYIAGCSEQHNVAPLDSDVRRHIAALRLRDGEQVKVLNGRGLIAHCTVERTPGTVSLVIRDRVLVPKPRGLTLVMSILDGRDRFEFSLEKATELGITRFVPLLAEKSQHHRTSEVRLQAKAIAAITQCGVAWLPEIAPPTTIDVLPWGTRVIVGDDKGKPPSSEDIADDLCVIVGPEGDFSEREKNVLRADPRTRHWAIGPNRLRAETAAMSLIANVVSGRS